MPRSARSNVTPLEFYYVPTMTTYGDVKIAIEWDRKAYPNQPTQTLTVGLCPDCYEILRNLAQEDGREGMQIDNYLARSGK